MLLTSREPMVGCRLISSALLSIFVMWVTPFFFGKYVDTSFPFIAEEDIYEELVGFAGSSEEGKTWCPSKSPYLRGMDLHLYSTLAKNYSSEKQSQESLLHGLQLGGIWQPPECQSRYEVVIIVPYRNRAKQLAIFLSYIHPFLQRQQLYYRIIVVEQMGNDLFNRGKLFNIGFKEAQKLGAPNLCLIFHDVDLIPQNDYNIYACTHQPRHMCSSVDIFRYHLPYRKLFGGANALLISHFVEVDGFSNAFDGWGGEDDDFERRLEDKGITFVRFDPIVARYLMIPHRKEKPSDARWRNLLASDTTGGLSTLHYQVVRTELFPLYTHIYIRSN